MALVGFVLVSIVVWCVVTPLLKPSLVRTVGNSGFNGDSSSDHSDVMHAPQSESLADLDSMPEPLLDFSEVSLLDFPRGSPPDPPLERYFFITHHKTGTVLMSGLADLLAAALGFEQRATVQPCNPYSSNRVFQPHPREFEAVQEWCPQNWRAVHMLRDPVDLLASAYIYHNQSDDIDGMATGPCWLSDLSLLDGLRHEARINAGPGGTLQQMQRMHQSLQSDPRVLSLWLEEFEHDFDKSVLRAFVHLLGEDSGLLERLVMAAVAHDKSRWSFSTRMNHDHLAKPEQKRLVRQAISQLLGLEDAAVQSVVNYSKHLSCNQGTS